MSYRNFKEETNMGNNYADCNVTAMNMEERRMDIKRESVMRTGIIAASTVAATGLVFGMSPAEVHAAEQDTNASEAAVQAPSGVSAPETLEDARLAADAARAEAEAADAAVEEATGKVSEAQTAFDTASGSAETARSEAEKAFADAKTEAAEADADAQSDVQAAENEVVEAENRVQQAEEEVTSAEASLEEAEKSAKEAESASPAMESDISGKEAELADDTSDLADAEKAFEEAESARNEVYEEVRQKETARSDAENAVKDAETEKAEADAAALSAADAADQAGKELQSAEDLKNGTLDLKDTAQYKEEQKAKTAMEKAAKTTESAVEAADKAAADLSKAGDAVERAEKELDQAAADLNSRESELAEAEKAKKAADTAGEKAQKAYDDAASGAADADAALSLADKAVEEAKDVVKAAEKAKNTADKAVREAADAVAAVRKDTEAAANAEIAAAEKTVAEKRAATETAQENRNTAAERYSLGTLGLIDWMLTKEGLTEEQIWDLTDAREILVNASEDYISNWTDRFVTLVLEKRGGKIVVFGDEQDATSLGNLFKSIEIMKKINELRATDDNYTGALQRNASYTNFRLMATAEAGAMCGAGIVNHSGFSGPHECLAFGFLDPTEGWYSREKEYFDRFKTELGITTLKSEEDVRKIEEEGDRRGITVRHYTSMLHGTDAVIGVGHTQYLTTSAFNSVSLINAEDRYDRAKDLYTVEDFEKLAAEYFQTVDKAACEDKLDSAYTAQSEAENRLQSLIDNKDAAVAAAIQGADSVLASKEADAEAAGRTLATAREDLAAAQADSQSAQALKLSADQALQAARTALDRAAAESRKADNGYVLAEKARDDAGKAVTKAESALKNAMTGKESAAAVLEEKKTALSAANTALHKAAAAHAAAEKKLADLTSDDTLDMLREQKQAADTALQSAMAKQGAAAEVLTQAKAVLAQEERGVSGAKTSLQEADAQLAQAAGVRDSAREAADKTARDLEKLREQYASALRAIAARDAAKERVLQAEAARGKAVSDLSAARTGLAAAQAAKEITGDNLLRASGLSVEAALLEEIEDPDFIYLNGYVSAMKKADTELLSAREGLNLAEAELSSRKSESANAQKAYTAALADLEVFRSREGMYQVNTEPAPEPALSAYTAAAADHREAAAQDVSGKDPGAAVCKAAQDTSGSNYGKTAPVASGDTTNVMGWLAGLLASAGIMVLDFGRKREKKVR